MNLIFMRHDALIRFKDELKHLRYVTVRTRKVKIMFVWFFPKWNKYKRSYAIYSGFSPTPLFYKFKIWVKSESEVAQSCPTLSNPMDCSLPGSSVHGIFQARVLESGAIAFSSSLYDVSEKGRRDGAIAAGTCRLKRRDFV